MIVRVEKAFASKKIKGKMIPPGIHDLNDDWAKELIKKGIAKVTTKYHLDIETRDVRLKAEATIEEREDQEEIIKDKVKNKK